MCAGGTPAWEESHLGISPSHSSSFPSLVPWLSAFVSVSVSFSIAVSLPLPPLTQDTRSGVDGRGLLTCLANSYPACSRDPVPSPPASHFFLSCFTNSCSLGFSKFPGTDFSPSSGCVWSQSQLRTGRLKRSPPLRPPSVGFSFSCV